MGGKNSQKSSKKLSYQSTHPWIDFALNVKMFYPEIWLQLGQIKSLFEIISGIPLKPGIAKELHRVYLTKGALATTAIEGNTLTEEEVNKYLNGKLKLPTSREYLGKEIDNVVAMFNFVEEEIHKGNMKVFKCNLIKKINKGILEGLELEDNVAPGIFRRFSVTVGGVYRGAPHEELDYLTNRFCEWMNGSEMNFDQFKSDKIQAVIKAIVAHIYIAWIHPFGDGNGRTARLIEAQILLNAGVPSPAVHLLSNHYNKTRTKYYAYLNKASKERNIVPFIHYALQGYVDELNDQLQKIEGHIFLVSWENYVHEQFQRKSGAAQERKKRIALDIVGLQDLKAKDIKNISTKVAALYANVKEKSIYADLKALLEMKLIKEKDGLYSSNMEILAAFLPYQNLK